MDQAGSSAAACSECRNRKIKCDRQLPGCASCKRAGSSCRFPSRDKRGSQTKQLASDMATFNGRLETMENSLSHRMEVLADLISQSVGTKSGAGSPQHQNPTSSPLRRSDSKSDTDSDEDSAIRSRSSFNDLPSPRLSVVCNDGLAERSYGVLSTYAHLVHARQSVERLLAEARGQTLSHSPSEPTSMSTLSKPSSSMALSTSSVEQIQVKYDSFTMPSFSQESDLVVEDKPLELPPQELLEASVEFYFQDLALDPPLFDQESLTAAIKQQYRLDPSQVDESWILCFNGIMLRSMGWKSKIVHDHRNSMSGINDQVLALLLSNADRAIKNADRFCNLRIVNIQALFLLALVARDYIHFNTFERMFDRACQLAKQMGLNDRCSLSASPSVQDIERHNLLWLLYSIDKQRIFIRGSPCRLYLFECDISLPSPTSDSPNNARVIAHLQLACVIEEIYKQLHSPKAVRKDEKDRVSRRGRLSDHLNSLYSQYQSDCLDSGNQSGPESTLALQLQYAFNVTRILIHSRSTDLISAQVRLDTARATLQIIEKLSSGSHIFNGGLLVLERLFCNYSIIAFYEVFESLVDSTHIPSSSDLALLATTSNALGLLSHPNRPNSYCTRLHKNLKWCTDIATLVQSGHPQNNGSPSPGSFSNASARVRSNLSPVSLNTPPKQPSSQPSVLSLPPNMSLPSISRSPDHLSDGDLTMDDGIMTGPDRNGNNFISEPMAHELLFDQGVPGFGSFLQTFALDGPLGDAGMEGLGFTQGGVGDMCTAPQDVAAQGTGFQATMGGMGGMGGMGQGFGMGVLGMQEEFGGDMQFSV